MGNEKADVNKKRASMESRGKAGWVALEAGDAEAAVSEYQEALALASELSDRGAYAVFLSYMGAARQALGDFDAARGDLEEAAKLAAESGLHQVEAHACLLLGEQERDNGHNEEAIQAFLQALEAAYNSNDQVGMEISLGNLGKLYLERGWAEQASEWFRHALDARATTPNRSSWLGSLGLSMAELGQFDEAIDYYKRAYIEAGESGDARTQSVCKGSEGNAYFEKGNLESAVECYQEALALAEKCDDGRRTGIWLGNIGNTYLKLGDIDKAVEYCEKAVALAERFKDLQSLAAHLDSLGDCLIARGDVAPALAKYQEALDLSQTIADRQGARIYLSNIGKAHQKMGQLQPAFDFYQRAIDLFDEQRSAIKADDLKTSFANRGQDLYRDMVKVCLSMGKRVEALEYVGRAKSRALLDLLNNSPIDISQLAEGDDESLSRLIRRESELRSQIAHFERLFWQGPPTQESGYRGAVLAPDESAKIYGEWRDVVNQLRRRHPNYATLITASTMNFDEIKLLWQAEAVPGQEEEANANAEGKADGGSSDADSPATVEGDGVARDGSEPALLPASTAILEFYWTDQYLMAACLYAGQSEPTVHFVSAAEDLQSFEGDLSSFLEMSATEGWEVPLSLCKRLYRFVLEPLLKELPETVDRLIVVPHSSLYHLPFAALHDGKGFLCQRFSLSYLPTTSLIPVLARSRAKSKEERPRYLVSAISDYSMTRKEGVVFSSRLRSAAGLEDLTYTLEEASTIFDLGSKSSPEAKLVTNEEVKAALPELFSRYPVVHFAGHAVFNQEEPLASGLVLSDGSILTAAAILQANALHTKCGRLLVLSACQTGVNLVTGGGEILGLARALMYAGMPNLVLSLWEVADRSTAALMKDFHQNILANSEINGQLDVAKSLQQAQREAAASGQPIHAWAPFIHMGIE